MELELSHVIDSLPDMVWIAQPDGGVDFSTTAGANTPGYLCTRPLALGGTLPFTCRVGLDCSNAGAPLSRPGGRARRRRACDAATAHIDGLCVVRAPCAMRPARSCSGSEAVSTSTTANVPRKHWQPASVICARSSIRSQRRPGLLARNAPSTSSINAGSTTQASPRNKLSGWGWAAAIHPADRAAIVDYWRSCLVSGTPLEIGKHACAVTMVPIAGSCFAPTPFAIQAGNISRQPGWRGGRGVGRTQHHPADHPPHVGIQHDLPPSVREARHGRRGVAAHARQAEQGRAVGRDLAAEALGDHDRGLVQPQGPAGVAEPAPGPDRFTGRIRRQACPDWASAAATPPTGRGPVPPASAAA